MFIVVNRAYMVASVPQLVSSIAVTQLSASKAGYATYTLDIQFGAIVQNVYALFGEAGDPLIIPAAFQVAAPFGTDVGPVRARAMQAAPPLSWTAIAHAADAVTLSRPCCADEPSILGLQPGRSVRLLPHHRPRRAGSDPWRPEHDWDRFYSLERDCRHQQ